MGGIVAREQIQAVPYGPDLLCFGLKADEEELLPSAGGDSLPFV